MTLEELKALYGEKGATVRREYETEGGTQYVDEPVDLGGGIYATENTPIIGYEGYGENQQPIYGEKQFTGFSKNEDGKTYYYNPEGQLYHVEKESSFWDEFGPMIMAAGTMGGGGALLGNALFGLSGTAASAAGNALLGAVNASETDQNILKGALLGGAAGAGSATLGDILGSDVGSTLGSTKITDALQAVKFAENPTVAGAVNLASPAIGSTQLGDTGISLGDVLKGVGTAQALGSGDYNQIFKALSGMAKDQGGSLKSSLAGFEANPEDFIEGYFQPGGEGYNALMAGDTTVLEDPQNLDAFLRMLSPYAADNGTSVFKQTDDVPELETVSNRPITSIESILGNPDILQDVPRNVTLPDNPEELVITGDREKPYVPSIRTKDIVSDIPDEITADQIDKFKFDTKIDDILQAVTPATKITTPVTTTKTAVTTPGTTTTEQALANLGLNAAMPSQDPYANIKLMEELFGGDTAYKLRALGAPKNLASADLDALARLLRG